MPFAPRPRARRSTPRAIRIALLEPARRHHFAVIFVIALVGVFAFVLLQPRRVRVDADGRSLVLSTRLAHDGAVLRSAGVDLSPGDRVTALQGEGDADVLRVERARTIVLHADGETRRLRTHALIIDQLLAEAGIAPAPRDSVLEDGALVSMNAPIEPPRLFATRLPLVSGAAPGETTIEVRRAVPFVVMEDGRESLSTSSRPSVAQALREAGIRVGVGDAITPGLQSALEANMRIEIRHAYAITVTVPDAHRVIYTLALTVGEALAGAGIAVPEGAFTDPPAATPVSAGMSVRIVQLSGSSDAEREYVESRTIYEPDAALSPGKTRVLKGHDGVRVRRYRVTYVDREEAGRELIQEYFDPEPVNTTVYYATRTAPEPTPAPAPAPRPAPAPVGAPPASTVTTLRVYATWYNAASSGRSPNDPNYGRTATGVLVTYGIVAVDPDIIPLGTRLYIPGYGYGVAADTGGAVKGYIIDLGFPDGVDVRWQSQWVDITVLP